MQNECKKHSLSKNGFALEDHHKLIILFDPSNPDKTLVIGSGGSLN